MDVNSHPLGTWRLKCRAQKKKLHMAWLLYLTGRSSKAQIHGWGSKISTSVCHQLWADLNQSLCSQTGIMGQVGRRQHLQSGCFLNPFQNPIAQSFQIVARGCFLKKESAFSALLVPDFKLCPSIRWFEVGWQCCPVFTGFPTEPSHLGPLSFLDKGVTWIRGKGSSAKGLS